MSEINDRRWTPFPMAAAETTTYYWLGVMCRQYTRWRRGITIDCIPYEAEVGDDHGCFVILLLWIPTRANTRLNCSDTIHMYFRWYRGMYMYFCTSTLPTWVPPRRTRRNVPEKNWLSSTLNSYPVIYSIASQRSSGTTKGEISNCNYPTVSVCPLEKIEFRIQWS